MSKSKIPELVIKSDCGSLAMSNGIHWVWIRTLLLPKPVRVNWFGSWYEFFNRFNTGMVDSAMASEFLLACGSLTNLIVTVDHSNSLTRQSPVFGTFTDLCLISAEVVEGQGVRDNTLGTFLLNQSTSTQLGVDMSEVVPLFVFFDDLGSLHVERTQSVIDPVLLSIHGLDGQSLVRRGDWDVQSFVKDRVNGLWDEIGSSLWSTVDQSTDVWSQRTELLVVFQRFSLVDQHTNNTDWLGVATDTGTFSQSDGFPKSRDLELTLPLGEWDPFVVDFCSVNQGVQWLDRSSNDLGPSVFHEDLNLSLTTVENDGLQWDADLWMVVVLGNGGFFNQLVVEVQLSSGDRVLSVVVVVPGLDDQRLTKSLHQKVHNFVPMRVTGVQDGLGLCQVWLSVVLEGQVWINSVTSDPISSLQILSGLHLNTENTNSGFGTSE
ncbi:hypothetical protein WICPIJ_007207 [Wickerhamomyces pijperi]|uniref:Uncharacterized protein n=1 Tax=Wickerhamomyces pijperi TaxID=599730 RepID=A0A9P8Q098_WICPI|nr:hypothetical protein WICPIJ_007207 [Wickerhamomyces pijperi]